MSQPPNIAAIDTALEAIAQNVYKTRALTERRVLHTPVLDLLVDRLGCQLAAYPADYAPRPGSHLIVATEFYAFGGHSQIARHLQDATGCPVLCTDLHFRYQNGEGSVVRLGSPTLVVKESGVMARIATIREWILALRPETIWILAHHYDTAAFAALNSSLRCRKVFIHHADHSVSLGAARRDYVHLDMDFLSIGSIAPFCHGVGKMQPRVVTAPGVAGIAEVISRERALQRLDALAARPRFATLTTGTPNKFKFDAASPLALDKVLGALFRSGTIDRHVHIGNLPDATLAAIRQEAAAAGIDFRHIPVSERFAADLVALDAEVFLGSFPTGGGSALNTALACGMHALRYVPGTGPEVEEADWTFGTQNPDIPTWSSAEELVARLRDRDAMLAAVPRIKRLVDIAWTASTDFAGALQRAIDDPAAIERNPAPPLNREAFHAARRAYRASYAGLVRDWRQAQRTPAPAPDTAPAPAPAAPAPAPAPEPTPTPSQPPVADAAPWLHEGRASGAPTAVVLHLYYPDLWPEMAAAIRRVGPCDLYVSLNDNARGAAAPIAADFPDAFVALLDNRGRDIAPRLELARRIRGGGYRQLLMLHGKKSPHLRHVQHVGVAFLEHRDGDRWRRELVEALVAPAARIVETFAQNPKVGLIGPTGFWMALRGDGNMQRAASLSQRMNLGLDPTRHGYFAGSMFWCRPQALEPLQNLNLGPQDFEAEGGQTDATLAHAVERAFALSAERAGFEVADTSGIVMTRPVPQLTPWLPEARWLPAERDWALQAARGWLEAGRKPPSFALAVLPHPAIPNAPTLYSLSQQWLGAHALEIPASGSTAELLRQTNQALLASGADWVGVIDAGDQLAPDALFRVALAVQAHPDWQLVYTDEDNLTPQGQHVNVHCKPDFNLDYLRALPYTGALLLLRRELFERLGGFDPQHEGAEDFDLVLRAWESLREAPAGEAALGHVAEVLYHRLQGSGHTAMPVTGILAAGQNAVQQHFDRLGLAVQVQPGPFPPSYRARWPLPQQRPMVSIMIPTRNQLGLLQRCVESLIEKTQYAAYEILIIDNDSDAEDARNYLAAIEAQQDALGGRLRVVRQPGPFNFSAMNNAAARAARGEYLLLLNNDTAALHPDWLDEMMSHAVRPDVGIVGAKLLFPDGRLQHVGVVLGMRGPAEHISVGHTPEDRGYFGRAQLTVNYSAVTGACLLIRRSVYEQVGGLDEEAFKVSYNDIDLCLKVREAGLRIVFTPYALLLHEGSASQRGQVEARPDEAKQRRFAAEKDAMYRKWLPRLAADPAYNRRLSLASTDVLVEDQAALCWAPEWRPRPRILVHPADREGCGEYRIIAPMRALNRAGLTQGWETMRLFEPAEMERMHPDSLVVQRQMEWPQIEALERHAKYTGAFMVFEIDDLITNLPLKSAHRGQMHKDIAKRFRKAAGQCNRLVVATEPLAKAYAGFSDEVVVCPNHLEGARWLPLKPARAERARPRVGWAGGIGHAGDLELIIDVVRETAAEVDWVFFGMCPETLRPLVKEFHTGIPLDQYAQKLASLDLDLAVAPLEDNPFNEAKSHLRLLEYGVLGFPVICSDLYPYQGDFPVTRVANRYRDWIRAIRDAVADRDALRAQGDALRAKVLSDWIMEDHLDVWLKAWTR